LQGLPGVDIEDGPQGYPVVRSFTFHKSSLGSDASLSACIQQNADVQGAVLPTANGFMARGQLSYPTRSQAYYEGVRYALMVSPGSGVYRFNQLQYVRGGGDFAAVEGMAPEVAYAKFQELADQIDRCAR
jgi:hypothetical protein